MEEAPLIVIRPVSTFSFGLRELWQYRELFYFFTWRDIKVKFKQTYLGVVWVLIQPLALVLIFNLIFSRTFHTDTGPIPYPVFVLCGLLLWILFSSSLSNASESMLQQAGMIKKIYFPRLIIPVSASLVSLFDFFISFIIFLIICPFYHVMPSLIAFLYIPCAVMIVFISAIGIGSFLSALNVKYRDFRYILPFLLQALFFTTQVVYPFKYVQQSWVRYFLALNPVNGAIELFRASFAGQPVDEKLILISTTTSLIFFVCGIFYFRKTEVFFADII